MDSISRRGFLNRSTALAAGCALPFKAGESLLQSGSNPKVRRYKPFGKTGFMVGDISAGAGQQDPGMINYLYNQGINLFDTAKEYGNHEDIVGQAVPKLPRNKIFICTKWDPYLVTESVKKEALMKELDIQLKTLRTNYVDCLMIHSYGDPPLGDIKRIQNPEIYEAFDLAKKLGKIKFCGASSHGPKMIEETEWALDNNRWDVVLIGANFLTRGLEPLLKKARAKGVATMAMKTMTIFRSDLNIRSLMNKNTNARQAVIKHILSSDLFDTMIIGMTNYDRINEYLTVSGTTSLTEEDDGLLDTLTSEISTRYCRPGCDGCYGVCPNNVPVWDVLRYKMYFENYGNEKYAIAKYMKLPESKNALNCENCDAPCEDACRYNLPVRERLLQAHTQLTLA